MMHTHKATEKQSAHINDIESQEWPICWYVYIPTTYVYNGTHKRANSHRFASCPEYRMHIATERAKEMISQNTPKKQHLSRYIGAIFFVDKDDMIVVLCEQHKRHE